MNAEIQNSILTPVRPNLGMRDRLDLFKATRIGAVDKNEPRKSLITRLAAIPALGTLVLGACGGATTETIVPPTSPTTITTEAPTTTTEAPTTSTSTTVPETTTTTLPADICEPTGQASIDGQNIELGSFREGYDFTEIDEGITGRLINVYEVPYEDYAGENTNVLWVDVCVEKYSDGNPLIASIMLGRLGLDTLDTKWFTQADLITSDKRGDQFYSLEDIKTELESRLENNSQVGFIIPNYEVPQLPEDFNFDEWLQGCVENYSDLGLSQDDFNFLARCQTAFERREFLPNNVNLINLLKQGNIDPSTEIKPITAIGILLFKPSIPSS